MVAAEEGLTPSGECRVIEVITIDSVNEEWYNRDESEENINRQQPKLIPGVVIRWEPETLDKATLVKTFWSSFRYRRD
jgi:hypothetical protein